MFLQDAYCEAAKGFAIVAAVIAVDVTVVDAIAAEQMVVVWMVFAFLATTVQTVARVITRATQAPVATAASATIQEPNQLGNLRTRAR